jgi:hypothetical protein
MKAGRLYMRRASIAAIRDLTRTWIQCAFARPRNGNGLIDFESPRLYQQFDRNPVFQAPFFQALLNLPEFIVFSGLISAQEELERPMNIEADVSSSIITGGPVGASPVAARVTMALLPELRQMNARFAATSAQLSFLASEMVALRGTTPLSAESISTIPSPTLIHGATGDSETGQAPPQASLKGRSRHSHVGPGHAQMMNLGEHETATSLVREYIDTIKPLEAAGNTWRRYPLASQAWYERVPIYRFIDRLMSEPPGGTREVASIGLQALAESAGKRGTSKAPNWKKVSKTLRESNPDELLIQQEKKRAAQENKNRVGARKALRVAVGVSANSDGDLGALVSSPPNPPP